MINKENVPVKRFKKYNNIVQLIPQPFNPEHNIQIYDLKSDEIRILGKVGVFFGILSILTVIYSVIKLICSLEFLSYPCLLIIFTATFCTSNIIFGMWILGKYIARIHDEVMKRPQYVVNEKLNVE